MRDETKENLSFQLENARKLTFFVNRYHFSSGKKMNKNRIIAHCASVRVGLLEGKNFATLAVLAADETSFWATRNGGSWQFLRALTQIKTFSSALQPTFCNDANLSATLMADDA